MRMSKLVHKVMHNELDWKALSLQCAERSAM